MCRSSSSRPADGRRRRCGSPTALRALVSIHDVAPRTLPQTLDICALLREQGVHPITLLVVPGHDWADRDLDVLRQLEESGHELAGHGWTHTCRDIRSWFHRIHSKVISRDLGEHLSLDQQQIATLIARDHQWFCDVGLRRPRLYVPPAWAMGSISRRALRELPFQIYEYLTGVYDAQTGAFSRLPLVGFEADTRLRQHVLRILNAVNMGLARALDRPLRVAVHPFDFSHRLARDLKRLVQQPIRSVRYGEIDCGLSKA